VETDASVYNSPFPDYKKLLTPKDIEYLRERDKEVDSNKDMRIRRKAINALHDLTFLAENIDFFQFRQIFTPENVIKLIKKICERIRKEDWSERYPENKRRAYKEEGLPDAIIADKELFLMLIKVAKSCLSTASVLIDAEFRWLITESKKEKEFPDKNIMTFMENAYSLLGGRKFDIL